MTSFAIGIVLLMLVFYAYMLSYGLGSMGMAEVIPSYGLAITGLITLFLRHSRQTAYCLPIKNMIW